LVIPKLNFLGGIERVFAEFLLDLSRSGYPIVLICQEVDKQLIPHCSRIIYLRARTPIFRRFPLLQSLFWMTQSSWLIKKENLQNAAVFSAPGGGPWRVDFAVAGSCHLAALMASAKYGAKKWLLNPSNYLIVLTEWYVFNFGCKKILVPSKRTCFELQSYYRVKPSKIVVLPHGVDTHSFNPPTIENKIKARLSLSIKPSTFVLLTVTNEVKRKGCFLVLDALKSLLDKGAEVSYIIVGRDDYALIKQYAIQLGVEGAVRFLPPKTSDELIQIFHIADVFVFPTFYESFGLVGMEAMACGLPLIATKVGGIEDYLINHETGLFVMRTPKDLEEKVLYYLEHPDEVDRMAKLARQQAERYEWDTILKKLHHLVGNRTE